MRVVLAGLLLMAAGCLGPGEEPAPPAESGTPAPCPSEATAAGAIAPAPAFAVPVREGFEATPAGEVPPQWTALDGRWGAAADPDAAGGSSVMRGQGDRDPGFSILLATPAGSLSDFTAQVAFKVDCVEHPHGVGLVLHVAGTEDYQIIRYSATESSWDLFTVKDGVREKQQNASVLPGTDPEAGVWTTLRVTSRGGHVEAFDGATKVIEYDLPAGHASEGQVGLFLRGSSSASFDDVRVDDLPVTVPVAPVAWLAA